MKVSVGMRAATGVGGDWLVFTPPVESAQTTSAQTLWFSQKSFQDSFQQIGDNPVMHSLHQGL